MNVIPPSDEVLMHFYNSVVSPFIDQIMALGEENPQMALHHLTSTILTLISALANVTGNSMELVLAGLTDIATKVQEEGE